MKGISHIIFNLFSIVLLNACSIVVFENIAQAQPARQEGDASGGKSTQETPLLEGGAQKFELNLEKLRDLGLDLKNVIKGASSLYDEVTIQPVTLIMQPNMVGRGTIIQRPIGVQAAGPPQPARKERVDLSMASLRPVVALLKRNVDDFIASDRQLNLPDHVANQLQPYLDEWIKVVGTMASQEARLEQLTQGPPYDNQAISALASAIQNETKRLDKIRRDVYKIIQKEGKRERKRK